MEERHVIIPLDAPDRPADFGAGPVSALAVVRPFLAGPEHALAVVALRGVMQPGSFRYSPLVLYGPTGAGKSHLARGLYEWCQVNRNGPAIYTTAADFACELASAIEVKMQAALRDKFRGAALFVLEDLGQLATKPHAQQELVHTLDALAECEAQVVITARHAPSQMPRLLSALRSRLSGGLAVPLALPGTQTREAIILQMSAVRGIELPGPILSALVDAPLASVPELYGALAQWELQSKTKQGFQRSNGHEAHGDSVSKNGPTVRKITALTAKYFGLKVADLVSPSRRRAIVTARGVAMFVAKQLTRQSLQKLGEQFGGRDHTTVLHSYRNTQERLQNDPATRRAIHELRQMALME